MKQSLEQQARFQKTPCLRETSRRKLKSVMWMRKDLDAQGCAKLLGREDEYIAKVNRNLEKLAKSRQDRSAFEVFMDMITSLGGHFEAVKSEPKKRVKEKREIRFVDELTSFEDGDSMLTLLEAQERDLEGEELAKNLEAQRRLCNSYYRDEHGSLIRLVEKEK